MRSVADSVAAAGEEAGAIAALPPKIFPVISEDIKFLVRPIHP